MRTLIIGDVVGRTGREAVQTLLPSLKEQLNIDCAIVNAENAASGFGITESICTSLFEVGVDVITTGNHIWDQKEVIGCLDRTPRVLRPINYPENSPGHGAVVYDTPRGHKVLVVNVMGRLFMDPLDDPFAAMEKVLEKYRLGTTVNAIFVDVHAEATSEKMGITHFLDGRITGVVGTHTHVPTADYRIFKRGTAYISDLGMTGDYESIIGMKTDAALDRFTKKFAMERLSAADGPATLCGAIIESNDATGHATHIEPVRLGGILSQSVPAGYKGV